MIRFLIVTFALLSSWQTFAQSAQMSAAELKLQLKKLKFLGSVLYVAAHPDDENTRAIAFLANDRLAATAYLSMTRGDGGQNLIGSEIRDLLGVIRTQELLAARRIDGGEQFFTRANDFGFSKNQQETFAIWGKDAILSDVVKIFRQYQPDVILTRFPPDERAGHGHHTASAVLAQEAFDLSANATYNPDEARQYGAWQPKRLYTNTGRWWNQTINENTPGVLTLNVGAYNALLGESYSEMAAASRTQHKSQGFGSPGRRGDALEFFEYVKGEKAQRDIFEGVNTTWTRVKGAERVGVLVEKAVAEFNLESPSASLPILFQIRAAISSLEPCVWKNRKLKEVNLLIQNCAGLFVESVASFFYVVPGEKMTSNFEVINRSNVNAKLQSLTSSALQLDTVVSQELKPNQLVTFKVEKRISPDASFSDPYWLRQPHTPGIFNVTNPAMIGMPENPAAISFQAEFLIQGEKLFVEIPVRYKWTDPVKGELYRPTEITPPVFVTLDNNVYLFNNEKPKTVSVVVKSASSKAVVSDVALSLESGWKAEPASHRVELKKFGEESAVTFLIYPPSAEATSSIKVVAQVDDRKFSKSLRSIQYDHIPVQTLLPDAEAKAIRLNIAKAGQVIGYVKGAGDEIPTSLRNMGYEVWEMKNEEITAENLARVDAVVLGIRALNTNERIRNTMPVLLEYAKAGGTVVVQYNTNFDFEIDADKFSPFPITLGRDRVTEEGSEVRILKPDHPVLNQPNQITAKDFEGWVQERGLYFPSAWDAQFEAILSMNDAGEKPKDGSLLVAKYGEGHYVYTGLSFFRQLPEGVTGAYKLFANIVSLRKAKKPENQKIKSKAK